MTPVAISLRTVLAGIGGTVVVLLLVVGFHQSSTPSLHLGRLVAPPHGSSDGSLRNVQNTTLGFQKIFAINIPSRTDHRDAMSLAGHLTGLQIDYVDGDTDVLKKTLPFGGEKFTTEGAIGAWRAHMNVLRTMVEQNITSALIMEDDTDWDIRIKSQMEVFALASRLLLQPLMGTSDESTRSFSAEMPRLEGFEDATHAITKPTSSPYGDIDRWDVLWLGHCGSEMQLPNGETPWGRATIYNDETVPEKQHLHKQMAWSQVLDPYPNHTRIIGQEYGTLCSSAYAVTLPAARRLLYELAIRKSDRAFDYLLSDACGGREDRPMLKCLAVAPQLFQHHRPIAAIAAFSDITGGDADPITPEYSKVAYSLNIRWSTKGNFQQLVYGYDNYTDLFRDGEPTPELPG